MDCDGPKHALIVDTDGTFVGSHPVKGSVAPFAELRYNRCTCIRLENIGCYHQLYLRSVQI